MPDIEELLRDTLTDPRRRIVPDPASLQRLDGRVRTARRRRTARRAAVATACAVLLGVAAVQLPRLTGPTPSGILPAAPSPAVSPPQASVPPTSSPRLLFAGSAIDVAAGRTALYALRASPPAVLRFDAATWQQTAAVGVSARTDGLTVDPDKGHVWTWTRVEHGYQLSEYDGTDLSLRRSLWVPTDVSAAAALGGELWVIGEQGSLYRVGHGTDSATPVAQVSEQVYAITADPSRHRVLVAGQHVTAIDLAGPLVSVGAPIDLIKPTLAVVDGRIWLGGYTSGDAPRLVRIDPQVLGPVGRSDADPLVGPGAVLWPGARVLWVRSGGDLGLTCVDPGDGRVLRHWDDLAGPVASAGNGAMVAGDNRTVVLDRDSTCPG